MSACIYHFNQDSERARWLKTAFMPHANAMMDWWQAKDERRIGKVAAKQKRMDLIKQAKGQ